MPLRNLKINLETKSVDNLPDWWITLFLTKATMGGKSCFGAVFGPANTCWPQNHHTDAELHDAQVGVFDETGKLISTHKVRNGNKYVEGGGIVYLDGSGKRVMWIGVDEHGRYEFLGERVRVADILITT
jgi:hypothetical protein